MKGFIAYTRVSTAKQGQQGVSLQEQRAIIERFAQNQQLPICAWYEERQTAAKRGRPIFSQILRRLRHGDADGLIVHKIDRGARNLRDWADLGDLIDQGVQVHFAGDNVDLQSRGGRLSADLQAVVAADYIRNLREETRKGFYGRLKQGLYPLPAPLGYVDCGRGKPKTIDPVQGALVRQAFELYSRGQLSLDQLVEEMHSRGLRNRQGGKVPRSSMSDMLNNRFYVGVIEIRRTQEVFPGIHEPLITPALFERVQQVLQGKARVRGRFHQFLFNRLWTCRHCQSTLVGELQKGHVYYRCHTKRCKTKCIREEALEEAILSMLRCIEPNAAELALFREELISLNIDGEKVRQAQRDAARLHHGKIESRLSRLTDALLDGLIDREAFAQRKATLLLEKKGWDLAAASEMVPQTDRVAEFLELAKSLTGLYGMANLEEKRELVRIVSSNRRVDGKNGLVELSEPFLTMANRHIDQHGGPSLIVPRTGRALLSDLIKWFAIHPGWNLPRTRVGA